MLHRNNLTGIGVMRGMASYSTIREVTRDEARRLFILVGHELA